MIPTLAKRIARGRLGSWVKRSWSTQEPSNPHAPRPRAVPACRWSTGGTASCEGTEQPNGTVGKHRICWKASHAYTIFLEYVQLFPFQFDEKQDRQESPLDEEEPTGPILKAA